MTRTSAVSKLSQEIGSVLRKKRLTLSVCESCTGGMLGSIITRVPGSSKYFLGGIIAYSNDSKRRIVGVQSNELKQYGAVSPEVAGKMAQGVQSVFKSDIGIGITGIAGPSGGSKKKPVGLVYISLSSKKRILVKKLLLKGSRDQIRRRVCEKALSLLICSLQSG